MSFQRNVEIFLFLLYATHAYSLKCYVCNSGTPKEEACAKSPVPERFLQECTHDMLNQGLHNGAPRRANELSPGLVHSTEMPKEATFCRKANFHIPEQHNGPKSILPASVRVIRSCGWIPEVNNNTCSWYGQDAIQYDRCSCTGDGCNAGGLVESLKFQTVLLISLITVGYYLIL